MDACVPTTGNCLDCGYDLRSLQSRHCPECGRLFDPQDVTTIGPPGLRLGPIGRWTTAPVGWGAWIFSGGILLAILWHARFPQSGREHFSTYRPLWPVLFAFWTARMVAQLFIRARLRHVALRRRINVTRTTLVLSAGLCTALAVHNDLVCRAALMLSRPAFERLASSAASTGDIAFPAPRWVGLYRVGGAHRCAQGQTYFYSGEIDAAFTLFPNSFSVDDYYDSTVVPFSF